MRRVLLILLVFVSFAFAANDTTDDVAVVMRRMRRQCACFGQVWKSNLSRINVFQQIYLFSNTDVLLVFEYSTSLYFHVHANLPATLPVCPILRSPLHTDLQCHLSSKQTIMDSRNHYYFQQQQVSRPSYSFVLKLQLPDCTNCQSTCQRTCSTPICASSCTAQCAPSCGNQTVRVNILLISKK